MAGMFVIRRSDNAEPSKICICALTAEVLLDLKRTQSVDYATDDTNSVIQTISLGAPRGKGYTFVSRSVYAKA